MDNKKEYVGCLAFLLPIWIIGSILNIIYNLFTVVTLYNYISWGEIGELIISVVVLLSLILLMNFKKEGFYIYIICFVLNIFIETHAPSDISSKALLHSFLGVALLSVLLGLKNKNKVSGFQLLGITESGESPEIETNRKEDFNQSPVIKEPKENISNDIQLSNNGITSKSAVPDETHLLCNVKIEENNDCTFENVKEEENKNELNNKINTNKRTVIVTILSLTIFAIVGGLCYYLITKKTPDEKFEESRDLWNNQKKYKEGIEILEELVKNNHTRAKWALGHIYLNGDNTDKNVEYGLQLLIEASEANDTSAMIDLADYYLFDQWNPEETQRLLIKAYNLGAITSFKKLTYLYYKKEIEGKSNPYKDNTKALYYAQKCADINIAYGFLTIGDLYSDGPDGIEENYDKALYWWKKGEDISCGCCANLGWLYFFGKGVDINYEKAYRYFRKAISLDKEDSYSINKIGSMFENGYYVTKDLDSAIIYYKRAADFGDEDAQVNYARMIK